MDNRNPGVTFDAGGQCNCCREAIARRSREWWPTSAGKLRLQTIIEQVRRSMQNAPYDIMIGLSGGVDSAFLAHLLKHEYNLRILAVHVDGGWNTEAAVHNIEKLVRSLDIDLHTYVVEWEEMRDLQLAYLKASVINQDAPQDHAFFSTLYRLASRFGQKYFMSGVNFSSENISIPLGGYPAMDGRNLKSIHRMHGTYSLVTFPVMSALEYLWLARVRKRINIIKPLDYLPYDKESAKEVLKSTYGFIDYGAKHNESRFTKFYQEIYLPTRFGFDKRRLHCSSLIVSGQMTREHAIKVLEYPLTTPEQSARDKRFVAKKLRISVSDLDALINAPPVPHEQYANSQALYKINRLVGALMRGN